jgi:16S rRNA (cytosine1407-C5)-methyltransferase
VVKGRPFPDLFLQKLKKVLPSNYWEKALKSFSQERPTTFRVNPLKRSSSSLKESLEPQGFKIENVPWYRDAFLLRKGTQRDLEKTDLYLKGEIYIQGLSSMIPPLVLEPRPGDWVLDLAAAPGSKTTQMASLMKNQGSILANDNNPIRLEKLKANAALQGASNIKLLPSGEGGMVWKTHYEKFDRVLLDTPCSSEGRFQLEKPSSFGYWKEDTNRKMAKDQRRLFKSALLSLKPGGRMVYSTCTFAPEENEMILNWALETYRHSLKILEIPLSLPLHSKGLTAWGDLKLDPSVVKSVRILPTADIEGFFCASLEKTKSIPPPKEMFDETGAKIQEF